MHLTGKMRDQACLDFYTGGVQALHLDKENTSVRHPLLGELNYVTAHGYAGVQHRAAQDADLQRAFETSLPIMRRSRPVHA